MDKHRRMNAEADDPCWCWGPFRDLEPDEWPETKLDREHEAYSEGCELTPPAPYLRDAHVAHEERRWER